MGGRQTDRRQIDREICALHRESETDKQTHTQTDTQTHRERHRDRDRERERQQVCITFQQRKRPLNPVNGGDVPQLPHNAKSLCDNQHLTPLLP